jgi:hypothetical protein
LERRGATTLEGRGDQLLELGNGAMPRIHW